VELAEGGEARKMATRLGGEGRGAGDGCSFPAVAVGFLRRFSPSRIFSLGFIPGLLRHFEKNNIKSVFREFCFTIRPSS
jgi:hypothetical protein